MNARKGGWRVIKTLTADDVRSIRTRELRGASEAHAAIGEGAWATEYARRAEELAPAPPIPPGASCARATYIRPSDGAIITRTVCVVADTKDGVR